MTEHPFRQVDVFGNGPYSGNPVAVILDADDLTTEQMARIANWTNLSETTFVLSPTDPAADYRVRIFTVAEELPFAGHPTLGTARAWLDAGGVPQVPGRVTQECGVGLVPLTHEGTMLAFAAPDRLRSGPVDEDDVAVACERLRLDRADVVAAEWVDNGPGWLGLLLKDAQSVLDVRPDTAAREDKGFFGIVGLYGDTGQGGDGPEGVAAEVRAFVGDPGAGLFEDPVTGSLNASVAQWLTSAGILAAPYEARQGTVLGRDGRITVTASDGELWIGGATQVAVSGTIEA
ncbi:PhzF family phenazine biosynthesis protein [Demequina salsinemoris]|uniref:PhzF family phenazine biosynthesis protein n=1 Tax=Demequina salsinemoris TaxID=577470 RepID=UPI00078395FE|nr:PhzF family phenazine biosynthesis protein [Demequina salsinemoris]